MQLPRVTTECWRSLRRDAHPSRWAPRCGLLLSVSCWGGKCSMRTNHSRDPLGATWGSFFAVAGGRRAGRLPGWVRVETETRSCGIASATGVSLRLGNQAPRDSCEWAGWQQGKQQWALPAVIGQGCKIGHGRLYSVKAPNSKPLRNFVADAKLMCDLCTPR